MQNPLDFCMTEVVANIPHQVLEIALRTYNRRFNQTYTLATFITKVIIHERVLKHANLVSGEIKTIPIKQSWLESCSLDHGGLAGDDGPFTIYRIPPEARDNLPITHVLSLQYPFQTYASAGIGDIAIGTGGYNLGEQIDQILNSYTLSTPRNHPIAKLMSGDMIKIIPSQYSQQNWLLTVRLAYNDAFTSLTENAILTLAECVVLATKQWCWTNLTVDIDRAVQETGADINTIRTIVDEYRDAANLFKEEMVKFKGCSLLSTEMRMRLLRYQI